jgi:hypothetical protein
MSSESLGDKLVLPGVVLTAVGVIVLGAFERMPYDYYLLVRIVSCFAAFILVASLEADNWYSLKIPLVFLAILYNPFIPIGLSRAVWFPINLLTIGLYLISLYVVLNRPKRDASQETPSK